jgi:hypothetical protein
MAGNVAEEPGKLVRLDDRAGWIIRVGEDYEPGVIVDGIQNCRQVESLVTSRGLNQLRAGCAHRHPVYDKGFLARDRVPARFEQSMTQQAEHPRGAGRNQNLFRRNLMELG